METSQTANQGKSDPAALRLIGAESSLPARPAQPRIGPAAQHPRDVTDLVSLSARARARIAGSLVAAQIPKADPVNAPPPPKPVAGAEDALPMYRHPADKNAAATAVTAGRRIDVTG